MGEGLAEDAEETLLEVELRNLEEELGLMEVETGSHFPKAL
jgi:hypothetical protein